MQSWQNNLELHHGEFHNCKCKPQAGPLFFTYLNIVDPPGAVGNLGLFWFNRTFTLEDAEKQEAILKLLLRVQQAAAWDWLDHLRGCGPEAVTKKLPQSLSGKQFMDVKVGRLTCQ